jgi:hypothetical protein
LNQSTPFWYNYHRWKERRKEIMYSLQAIKTSVIPCTETKPTRVKASLADCRIATIVSVDSFDSYNEAHFAVAKKLAKQLGWVGVFTAGSWGSDTFYWTVGPRRHQEFSAGPMTFELVADGPRSKEL